MVKKPTGTQNYLCRNSSCSKQFQLVYKNQGANPVVKNYVEEALAINCGIKDIKNIFKVSKTYILKRLIIYASKLEIKPPKAYYESLQIGELL